MTSLKNCDPQLRRYLLVHRLPDIFEVRIHFNRKTATLIPESKYFIQRFSQFVGGILLSDFSPRKKVIVFEVGIYISSVCVRDPYFIWKICFRNLMRRCSRLWPAVFFLLLTITDKKWYRIDISTFRVGERLGLSLINNGLWTERSAICIGNRMIASDKSAQILLMLIYPKIRQFFKG